MTKQNMNTLLPYKHKRVAALWLLHHVSNLLTSSVDASTCVYIFLSTVKTCFIDYFRPIHTHTLMCSDWIWTDAEKIICRTFSECLFSDCYQDWRLEPFAFWVICRAHSFPRQNL